MRDTVDSARIESDEDGFHLILEGSTRDYDLHLTCPLQLLEAVEREIRPWRDEGAAVLTEMRRIGFRCNPDDSGGYAPDDPKHPDWHSVHADHYNSREGK